MDQRIARLKTSNEAQQVAENARLKGFTDLQAQALEHAKALRAREEGFTTPAELAIADALYTYEEEQNRLLEKTNYRANRLRGMLKRHGPLQTAERMALDPKRSTGFKVLEGAGKREVTFESIIVQFPDEFSKEALVAARARLSGETPPRRPRNKASEAPVLDKTIGTAPAPAKLDGEGKMFWRSFKTTNKFMGDWLPKYEEAVKNITQALLAERADELFNTMWRTPDNDIANAGAGLLKFDTVDEMRDDLIQVIRDVYANSNADNYESIVGRFELWRDQDRIRAVPRLLIARSFAGIHPNLYHTTVDADSHDKAVQWFVEHTGFVEPKSKSWAVRAQALTTHMTRIEEFGEDIFVRNIFPWFVAEQVCAQKPSEGFKPGHRPRVPVTTSDIPEHQRKIDLRHNRVQNVLYNLLATEYGKDKVRTEHPTGTGGYADAVVKL
ncbi:MAG TPA: hypothetical protein VIE65_16820, partial [Methylobacter sp.]